MIYTSNMIIFPKEAQELPDPDMHIILEWAEYEFLPSDQDLARLEDALYDCANDAIAVDDTSFDHEFGVEHGYEIYFEDRFVVMAKFSGDYPQNEDLSQEALSGLQGIKFTLGGERMEVQVSAIPSILKMAPTGCLIRFEFQEYTGPRLGRY